MQKLRRVTMPSASIAFRPRTLSESASTSANASSRSSSAITVRAINTNSPSPTRITTFLDSLTTPSTPSASIKSSLPEGWRSSDEVLPQELAVRVEVHPQLVGPLGSLKFELPTGQQSLRDVILILHWFRRQSAGLAVLQDIKLPHKIASSHSLNNSLMKNQMILLINKSIWSKLQHKQSLQMSVFYVLVRLLIKVIFMISFDKHRRKEVSRVQLNNSLATQSQLIDCFTAYKIPEFYQKLVIGSLKKLPSNQIDQQMKKQIQSISSNESTIQIFMKKIAEKSNLENYLKLVIKSRGSSRQKVFSFQKVCQQLIKLRQVNYALSYSLGKVKDIYEHGKSEGTFYCDFAVKLNSFGKELIRSQLGAYFQWQQSYDPFFLFLKQKDHKIGQSAKQKILQLISIDIDESYGLLKMHKILQGWVCQQHRKQIVSEKGVDKVQLPPISRSVPIVIHKRTQTNQRIDLLYNRSNENSEGVFMDEDKTEDMNKTRYAKGILGQDNQPSAWRFDKLQGSRQTNSRQQRVQGESVRHKQGGEKQKDDRKNHRSQPFPFVGSIKKVSQPPQSDQHDSNYSGTHLRSVDHSSTVSGRDEQQIVLRTPQRRFNAIRSVQNRSKNGSPRNHSILYTPQSSKRVSQKIEKNLINIEIAPFTVPQQSTQQLVIKKPGRDIQERKFYSSVQRQPDNTQPVRNQLNRERTFQSNTATLRGKGNERRAQQKQEGHDRYNMTFNRNEILSSQARPDSREIRYGSRREVVGQRSQQSDRLNVVSSDGSVKLNNKQIVRSSGGYIQQEQVKFSQPNNENKSRDRLSQPEQKVSRSNYDQNYNKEAHKKGEDYVLEDDKRKQINSQSLIGHQESQVKQKQRRHQRQTQQQVKPIQVRNEQPTLQKIQNHQKRQNSFMKNNNSTQGQTSKFYHVQSEKQTFNEKSQIKDQTQIQQEEPLSNKALVGRQVKDPINIQRSTVQQVSQERPINYDLKTSKTNNNIARENRRQSNEEQNQKIVGNSNREIMAEDNPSATQQQKVKTRQQVQDIIKQIPDERRHRQNVAESSKSKNKEKGQWVDQKIRDQKSQKIKVQKQIQYQQQYQSKNKQEEQILTNTNHKQASNQTINPKNRDNFNLNEDHYRRLSVPEKNKPIAGESSSNRQQYESRVQRPEQKQVSSKNYPVQDQRVETRGTVSHPVKNKPIAGESSSNRQQYESRVQRPEQKQVSSNNYPVQDQRVETRGTVSHPVKNKPIAGESSSNRQQYESRVQRPEQKQVSSKNYPVQDQRVETRGTVSHPVKNKPIAGESSSNRQQYESRVQRPEQKQVSSKNYPVQDQRVETRGTVSHPVKNKPIAGESSSNRQQYESRVQRPEQKQVSSKNYPVQDQRVETRGTVSHPVKNKPIAGESSSNRQQYESRVQRPEQKQVSSKNYPVQDQRIKSNDIKHSSAQSHQIIHNSNLRLPQRVMSKVEQQQSSYNDDSESEEQSNINFMKKDDLQKSDVKQQSNNRTLTQQVKTSMSHNPKQISSQNKQQRTSQSQVGHNNVQRSNSPKKVETNDKKVLEQNKPVSVSKTVNNEVSKIPSVEKRMVQKDKYISRNEKQLNNHSTISSRQKKEVKIRIGKLSFDIFAEYLYKYQLQLNYQNLYDLEKVILETKYQQTYLTEFYIGGQPGAIALSSITQNNNFVIRFWALTENNNPKIAIPLFKKYLEFMEKYVRNQLIYYRGIALPQVLAAGFTQKKSNIYQRKRNISAATTEREFDNFVGISCNNIAITQKQKQALLYSTEIEIFSENKSKCGDFLTVIRPDKVPQQLVNTIKVYNSIQDLPSLNQILSKNDLEEYQLTKNMQASEIDLSFISIVSEFKDLFIANQTSFKFYGNVVTMEAKKTICSVKLTLLNGRLLFAKGFKSVAEVSENIRKDSADKIQFVIPMFNKQLFGEYPGSHPQGKKMYGSWDISLCFENQMQGAIRHTFDKCLNFGDTSFHFGIELQGHLCYLFAVEKEDYLF